MPGRLTRAAVGCGLVLLLVFVMGIAVTLGVADLSPVIVFAYILDAAIHGIPPDTSGSQTIILLIRLPRVILAALVGASLAASGTALQSLFRNPMADPFILGISSGAGFGATLVLLYGVSFGLGVFNLPLASFACGALTVFLVYTVARTGRRVPVTTLLLSGIAVSAFFSACTSFLLFSSSQNLHQVIFWMMGGLWGRGWEHVYMVLPFAVAGSAILLVHARSLNALMFGEESAHYLGVGVERLKNTLLVVTALLTGAAVAVSGIIGFVGLITPHIARLLVGPDHRILLPVSVITGAIFLVVADLASRLIIAPGELPIGILTAFCGAPFFLYLLRTRRGGT